jgi:hypothetical protein
MEITRIIQQLLFQTIDSLAPEAFADPAGLRQFLMKTAEQLTPRLYRAQLTPYLYDSVCRQIDMLIAE